MALPMVFKLWQLPARKDNKVPLSFRCHEPQCIMTRSCNSQMQMSFQYVIQVSRYAI